MTLAPITLSPSFGFGDRPRAGDTRTYRRGAWNRPGAGLRPAVRAREYPHRPLPQQVLEDARRAVEAAGWDAPWGADADHLKSVDDFPPFVAAGYTLFTVDPGEHVDNAASIDPLPVLREKAKGLDWDQLEARLPQIHAGTALGTVRPGVVDAGGS